MSSRANLVNLDAMIKREDFAVTTTETQKVENISTISLRDFTQGGLLGPFLRKPDFQRETNHWSPEQVVSLLECFVGGDLIPSVILWQSPIHVFVIDGGHRLSVLKAWVEDDYGDGHLSQSFFGYKVSKEQTRIAERTRQLINQSVGSWKQNEVRLADESLAAEERGKLSSAVRRGLPIQWVNGDAEKAENSFFKINTKGTPLDHVEETLLKSRKKPIAIAARAVIRAGRGHRYWSNFTAKLATEIEESAALLHSSIFEPELKTPIKTLDLPLGGPRGVRTALETLIDLILIACRDQAGNPNTLESTQDDVDGQATVDAMRKTLRIVGRVTGNDQGSLGLHPAVYFYGPTVRHSAPMFMGTFSLIGHKLSNNDKDFFKKFTRVREALEQVLLVNKDLIATILQKHVSGRRVHRYERLLENVIDRLSEGQSVSEEDLVKAASLEGKIILGRGTGDGATISEDARSKVFIDAALPTAVKCAICRGYVDTTKSVSYDHIKRVRDGGSGHSDNVQLTHPYCNQSVKQ